VALLPDQEAAIAFADVALLRRSGILERIAGGKLQEDEDYRRFVAGAGFDYRRDLDAVAISVTPTANYGLARGRFDRARIEGYLTSTGALCQDGLCAMPASRPGWTTSMRFVAPDVIALASSADPAAARGIASTTRPARGPLPVPRSPAWIYLPASADRILPDSTDFLRLIRTAISSASYTVFSAEILPRPGVVMRLQAPDAATAARISGQLATLRNDPEARQLLPFLATTEFRLSGAGLQAEWRLPIGN
jgi:hypothetical protein